MLQRRDARTHGYKIVSECSKDGMHEIMNTKYFISAPKTGCTSTWIQNISWMLQQKDVPARELHGYSKDRMQEHKNTKQCMDTSKDVILEHIHTKYCMGAQKTGCKSTRIQTIAWTLQRQDARAHDNKILHGFCNERMHQHVNTKYCMDAPKTGSMSTWKQNIAWLLTNTGCMNTLIQNIAFMV